MQQTSSQLALGFASIALSFNLQFHALKSVISRGTSIK